MTAQQQSTEKDWLDHEFDKMTPLLSLESYQRLKSAVLQLKKNAPPASGIGVENLNYVPRTCTEYQQKLHLITTRLEWTRTAFFLTEMLSRHHEQENRQLLKKNEQLTDENTMLRRELARARLQIQQLLRVKKTRKGRTTPESDTQAADQQKKEKKRKKKRGAPPGHRGETRPRPDSVDEVRTIDPPQHCPHCGSAHIITGNGYYSVFQEDIPPIVKKVIEFQYRQGTCCDCQRSVVAPEATKGPRVKIGPQLKSLLTVMRAHMGVSYRKLSQFCTESLNIPLSPSGAFGIIARACHMIEPLYYGLEASLPNQEVLFADETGWRMDGKNWYLWCFCNQEMSYFHLDPSRGSIVPQTRLGVNYSGLVHADFYSAYNFLKNTQRCLVHLLRDIHNEIELSPNDKSLARFHTRVHELIKKGTKVQRMPPSALKTKKRARLEKQLTALTKMRTTHDRVKTLIKRLKKHQASILQFVDHTKAEFHNNRAERALRPAVIFRKTTFGNRTTKGALNFAILATVQQTCRVRNYNFKAALQTLFTKPRASPHLILREILDSSQANK
jgi:hypothetical protein